MLFLGSTYFAVKNMEKSIEFFRNLLDTEPKSKNPNRWAEFHGRNFCIALYNRKYDLDLIDSGEDISNIYNNDYLDFVKSEKIVYGTNVVLNFWVEDLNSEYERLIDLNIGEMTKIFFINVIMPYYCFMIKDPDGNSIEITGEYKEVNQ